MSNVSIYCMIRSMLCEWDKSVLRRVLVKVVCFCVVLLFANFSVKAEKNVQVGHEVMQDVFYDAVDSARVSLLKLDIRDVRNWMNMALMSICDSDTYHTYKLLEANVSLFYRHDATQELIVQDAGYYFLDRSDSVAIYAMGCYWSTMANYDMYSGCENAELYYAKATEVLRSGGFDEFANQCRLYGIEAYMRNQKYVEAASLARELLSEDHGDLSSEIRFFCHLYLYRIYTNMRISPMVEYYGKLIEDEGFYAESLAFETQYLQRKIMYLMYLNDLEEAIPLCKRFMQIGDLLRLDGVKWNANVMYSRLMLRDKRYSEALKYINQCYDLYKSVGGKVNGLYFSKDHVLLAHAWLTLETGNVDGALELLAKINENSKLFKIYDFVKAYYNCRRACYEQKGEYIKAMQAMELERAISDSIVNDHIRQRTIDLEGTYRDDATILSQRARLTEQEVYISSLRKKVIVGLLLVGVLVMGYYLFKVEYKRRDKLRRAQLSKDMNESLEREVSRQTEELIRQAELIRNRNNDIMLSQLYAQRIQQGILPQLDKIKMEGIEKSFVIFRPIATVSGDFYWFDKVKDRIVICCADSSGHGVPGAMMSMVGMTLVTEVVRRMSESTSEELMNTINNELLRMMPDLSWLDGINMSLVVIEPQRQVLNITLARHNALYCSGGEFDYIRGTKRRIGDRLKPVCDRKFQMFTIEYKKGDSLYLYTNGVTELFGNRKSEKLKISGLKKILHVAQCEDIDNIEQSIDKQLDDWCGAQGQNDDVLIIGLQL